MFISYIYNDHLPNKGILSTEMYCLVSTLTWITKYCIKNIITILVTFRYVECIYQLSHYTLDYLSNIHKAISYIMASRLQFTVVLFFFKEGGGMTMLYKPVIILFIKDRYLFFFFIIANGKKSAKGTWTTMIQSVWDVSVTEFHIKCLKYWDNDYNILTNENVKWHWHKYLNQGNNGKLIT